MGGDHTYLCWNSIFFNVYLFLRQRQSMNGGGSEREGDTESETGSRLWAVSTEPDAGLELTYHEIVTWAEVGRLTHWATQAPLELNFYFIWFYFILFYFILFYFILFQCLFIFETETEHEWGRGRERGRHRIGSRLQALSHQLRAQHGAWTHGPWDRDLSWSRTLNRLSHPGAPAHRSLNNDALGMFYMV